MGSLLMALGVVVVTQAQAAVNWLSTEPTPVASAIRMERYP
jgi:hypothetical protein